MPNLIKKSWTVSNLAALPSITKLAKKSSLGLWKWPAICSVGQPSNCMKQGLRIMYYTVWTPSLKNSWCLQKVFITVDCQADKVSSKFFIFS